MVGFAPPSADSPTARDFMHTLNAQHLGEIGAMLLRSTLPGKLRRPKLAVWRINRAIEKEGSTDEREMRQRLWEVSEKLCLWAEFFRIKTHMVGIGEKFLKLAARFIDPASSSQTLDVPEAASSKCTFIAVETVVFSVAHN